MKDLNEYKQMIFQRSEKKLKRRKQVRTRIVACCIPLAVCILAISAWNTLPRSISKDAAPESGRLTGMVSPGDGNATGSAAQAYTAQISRGSSEPISISDQAQIHQLIGIIENCYETDEIVPEEDDEIAFGSTLPTESIVGSTLPNYATGDFGDQIIEKYTISLQDPSGNETVYSLTGNQLTNTLTAEAVLLDNQQLNALLDVLEGLI